MVRTLLLLSKLRFYGGLRKLKRALATPKGALLILFTVAFFGAMLLPAILTSRLPHAREANPQARLVLHPAALFGLWLVTSIGSHIKSPIAFSLAEVEFLFPGPFTRRTLLSYKLLISSLGTLGVALMVPLAWFYIEVWWPAAFLGIWWALCFMQMSTVLLALAMDWFGERFRRLRLLLAVALAIVVVAEVWRAGVLEPNQTIPARLEALDASWLVQAVLSPFVVFNRLISAETVRQLLGWGAAALAVNLVVVVMILRLDANFLEASLVASQRRYDWLERAKRSGGVPSIGARSKPRFSLPRFPRLGGVGPIAWRQMLQLLRGSSRLIFIVPALIGPFAGLLAVNRHEDAVSSGVVVSMTLFLGLFITTVMPLGLRADLDHVDVIKTLPLSAGAIVWGSIVSAIFYTTLVQIIAAGSMAAVAGRWTLPMTAALVFAVPINLLMVSSDSVLVLLFPTIRRIDPSDVLVGIRFMLINVAKVLYVVVMGGVAALFVFAVYLLLGEARVLLALGAWLVLSLEGLATIWVAGLLFENYDPSSHSSERE